MAKQPLLTVAIPTFNAGDNLLQAIESCKYIKINQDDLEILVVDNCSSDNSIDKLRQYQKNFPFKITIHRNEKNLGRIGNWNKCLELTQGRFLIFLFVNDRIYPKNAIKECIDIMQENDITLCLSTFTKKTQFISSIERKFYPKQKIVNSQQFLTYQLNQFFLPFGPLQANIFETKIIKDNDIHFIDKLPINTDQLFCIYISLLTSKILYNPVPQVIWSKTKGRYHSQKTLYEVTKSDLALIKVITKNSNLQLDKTQIIANLIVRTLTCTSWSSKNKRKLLTLAKREIKKNKLHILKICQIAVPNLIKKIINFILRPRWINFSKRI